MKKIMAVVLVFSVAFMANAQEIPDRKGGKPGMHKRHHGMAMHQLNLTDAQKEQFKKERESFQEKMSELKKNENITVKEWKSRMETLRKEHKAKTESILTADQKAQVEKMKAEGKAKHEEMMKKRGEGMKTRLGLTDDQSAKLEQHRKDMGEKMKTIREDKSLNDEQKREKMKELMKNRKESLKSILTEEQMNKMKEGMHKGQHKDGNRHGMKKETI